MGSLGGLWGCYGGPMGDLWCQMLTGYAIPAECAGAVGDDLDDIIQLSACILVSNLKHASLPCKQGAADLIAPRIPPGQIMEPAGNLEVWKFNELADIVPPP